MKEFVETLIDRLEKYKGKIKLNFGNRGNFEFMEIEAVKDIANKLAEEHKIEFLENLVLAKKNCPGVRNCSDCPFGQIDYRCILAELQIDNRNGWIPCNERLPIGEKYRNRTDGLWYYKYMLTTTNDIDIPICVGWYDQEEENWYDLEGFVYYPTAWQPLPEPYKEIKK